MKTKINATIKDDSEEWNETFIIKSYYSRSQAQNYVFCCVEKFNETLGEHELPRKFVKLNYVEYETN